ncbi:MAG: hypothetical protein QM638_15750 [Nocardioides sp.]|uniref:hypothetical protein n=1 Tax=Nocardioides sp. TaxID=35761 RepID=UPI0039E4B6CA
MHIIEGHGGHHPNDPACPAYWPAGSDDSRDPGAADWWEEPGLAALLDRAVSVIERLEHQLHQPAPQDYQRALDWLEAVCGGPEAVAALDDSPLREPTDPMPTGASPSERERLTAVAAILGHIAAEFFDPETGVALRNGLRRLWAAEPLVVCGGRSATQVAAGLSWAVGDANGLVGRGLVTATRLKQFLALPQTPGVYAQPVVQALQGFWPWHHAPMPWALHRLSGVSRPSEVTTLGHPDLLLGRVRARLIRVREHARAAERADRGA